MEGIPEGKPIVAGAPGAGGSDCKRS